MKIITRSLIFLSLAVLLVALAYQFLYMPHAFEEWRLQHATEEIAIYYEGEGRKITCALIYIASAVTALLSVLGWALSKVLRPRNP